MALSVRWAVLGMAILAFIIVPFLIFEDAITAQAERILTPDLHPGLVGIFIGLLLAGDVVLPVPSSLVSASSGAFLGFAGGTLVCWIGMTLGCLFGHWIGSTGGTAAIRRLLGEEELEKASSLATRFGWGMLVLMRAVPVLAEASTIAAGAAGLSLLRFTAVTALANLGIAAVYAAIGAYAYEANSFLLAFAGALAVPAVALLGYRYIPRFVGRDAADNTIKADAAPLSIAPPDSIVQSFSVPFDYPVIFASDVLAPSNPTLAKIITQREPDRRHSVTVFADTGVIKSMPGLDSRIHAYVGKHSDSLTLTGPVIGVPGGEVCKNDGNVLAELYKHLRDRHVDRQSYVLAIGGGAVLDVAGFAAATAHRGIRLIRLPTTVLAQNDSGVGVKNGINMFGVKNFIGSFAPPYAVINDVTFLDFLPARHRRSGLAEAVKVALIRDREFFAWLEGHADELAAFKDSATKTMIRRTAELHMVQIAKGGDPFETGSARPLDFGHWVAHKLESLSSYELQHGEAVAIGIALDSRYSVLAGLLRPGLEDRICTLLERLGFTLWHPLLGHPNASDQRAVLDGLREFREHLGGELTVTLLSEIGSGVEVHEMNERTITEAIRWLDLRTSG